MTFHPAQGESDDYPPLSALNHLLYCPRRCALLRIRVWVENVHTTGGTLDHIALLASREDGSSVRVVSGLRLVSHTLRLTGIADVGRIPEPGPSGSEVRTRSSTNVVDASGRTMTRFSFALGHLPRRNAWCPGGQGGNLSHH